MTNFASKPTELTEAYADFEASKAREQILRDWRDEVIEHFDNKRIGVSDFETLVHRPLFIDEGAAS